MRKPFEPLIGYTSSADEYDAGYAVVSLDEANAAIEADREHHDVVAAKWKEACEAIRAENNSLKAIVFVNQKASLDLLCQLDTLKAHLAEAKGIIQKALVNWCSKTSNWELEASAYLAKFKREGE